MLVLVTRNQQKHTPLLQWLTQHGIYTWVTSPDAAQAIICEKDTGGVILDTPGNLSTMEALCRTLRESYPPMPIAAIVAKEAIPNMQVNRILREGREGISREDVLEFATVNCAWHAEHLSSPYLFVGNAPEETLYMGYRLHLSPAEHILLRCLFYRYPTPTASADLLMLCYPCKTERRENLAVLIGRINRRAQEIDPHPLIVPLQGKGYVLRSGIVSTTIERTPPTVMKKIGINCGLGFELDQKEMMHRIKAAGFDAVFVGWGEGCPLDEWKKEADALGLEMPFIHAPFSKIEYIWEDHELGEWVLNTQIACVEDAAKNRIDTVVCHVYKGFGKEEKPTELGLARIQTLLDRALACGVKVAFENTEGEVYLDAILKRFWDHPATGFCIDTGHEVCYNYSHDLISKYADKLIATHLDDNLGISGESIFWTDDLHLLPFDGVVDFEGVARRIQKTPFDGILMFELTAKSKPHRHENDAHFEMGCEQYLALAHERAVRFAKLFE